MREPYPIQLVAKRTSQPISRSIYATMVTYNTTTICLDKGERKGNKFRKGQEVTLGCEGGEVALRCEGQEVSLDLRRTGSMLKSWKTGNRFIWCGLDHGEQKRRTMPAFSFSSLLFLQLFLQPVVDLLIILLLGLQL